MTAPFCAICTAHSIPLTSQPLGRDGAMVNVCAACDEPVFTRGEMRPAYTGGAGVGIVSFGGEISDALRKAKGDEVYATETKRMADYGKTPSRKLTREELDMQGVVADGQRRFRTGAATKAKSKGRTA